MPFRIDLMPHFYFSLLSTQSFRGFSGAPSTVKHIFSQKGSTL